MKTIVLISILLVAGGIAPAKAQQPFNSPGIPGGGHPSPEWGEAGDPAFTGTTRSRTVRTPASRPVAQQLDTAPDLGGGFIEFLLTGREPPPRRFASPSAVPGHAVPVRPVTVYRAIDPYTGQAYEQDDASYPARPAAPRSRLATLPGADDYEPLARETPARFRRQLVDYDGPHQPGTIVVNTTQRYLYFVQEGGKAMRYGIGVGREGFTWRGMHPISMKREWPDWRPPVEMLKRRPDLPRHMAGGPANPLGARALYLGSSLYRIHGTNEPHTIGQNVSSGCIRLTNDDVIDLYERVRVGTRVIVT